MSFNLDNKSLEYFTQNQQKLKEDPFIVIEKGAYMDVLVKLNEYISINSDIKLVLICNPSREDKKTELIYSLDVLFYLNHLKHISILVHSSSPLKEIQEIKNLKELISFSLSGFYEKKLNLDILDQFTHLKSLKLEDGALKNKNYQIINRLHVLEVMELDLEKVDVNKNLHSLSITKKIKSPSLLKEKFPCLRNLEIKNGTGIEDFSFLTDLHHLESLYLNGIKSLIVFPVLEVSLKHLIILHSKNLKNVEAIKSIKSLSKLAITDSIVPFEQIEDLAENLDLEVFYFWNKNIKEVEKFNQISQKLSFKNSSSALYD